MNCWKHTKNIYQNINKKGGTIIFTTHYPELLDEYDRNDGIHIIRNKNGITVENLSNILKRNDKKKVRHIRVGFLKEQRRCMNLIYN